MAAMCADVCCDVSWVQPLCMAPICCLLLGWRCGTTRRLKRSCLTDTMCSNTFHFEILVFDRQGRGGGCMMGCMVHCHPNLLLTSNT